MIRKKLKTLLTININHYYNRCASEYERGSPHFFDFASINVKKTNDFPNLKIRELKRLFLENKVLFIYLFIFIYLFLLLFIRPDTYSAAENVIFSKFWTEKCHFPKTPGGKT